MKFKKLVENAHIPTYGSDAAAGADLYAAEGAVIKPGEMKLVDTGIAVAIPSGFFGAIFARSGLATKQGLRPANCVGVVDADYRGPVKVALYNDSDKVREVQQGDRIAQFVIMPFMQEVYEEVDDLDKTERGAGGFGSTGVN